MYKKRLGIVGLFVLAILFLPQIQTASAGCCVDQRFGACTDATDAAECTNPSDFDAQDCSETTSCDVVCCYDTTPPGSTDAAYRIGCKNLPGAARFTIFSEIGPYEPSLSLNSAACQSCTENLVETCPDGSKVTTAYCDIRPPQTTGIFVPSGRICPTVAIEDSDGDGESDATDVCPDERAITTQPAGTAPHFESETGYCRDFIDNDCDGLTDYADRADCPAPCTTDIVEICPDRTRVTTYTCDQATHELHPTGRVCLAPETVPSGTCGDGTVQQPNAAFLNEQCDWGTASPDTACGSDGTCRGEGDPRACMCEYRCISDPGQPFTPTLRRLSVENEISWGSPSTCEIAWFDIYRCEGTECDPLSGHVVHRLPAPVDSSLYLDPVGPELAEMPMCYQIVTHYINGVETASEPACTGAAPAECSRFDVPFCDDDHTAVVTCTETGATKSLCGPNEFCRESPSGAECAVQSPCEQCNGFLELFGFLDITIPAGACNLLPSCAKDYSKSIVDKYFACSKIDSCYDYNSPAACEADARTCNVGRGGCQWVFSPNAQAVGAGVCRPISEADQDCKHCNAETGEHDNTYFTGCTAQNNYLNQQNCALYGFDRDAGISSCRLAPNPTPGTRGFLCQNAHDLGCESYGTDAAACGAMRVDVDVSWDGGVKTAGTNAITTRSNDAFQYGTCRFASPPSGGAPRCFKDADDNAGPDCDVFDFACQKDNTPPTTVITAINVPVRDEALLLGRNVQLDVSLSEQGTTFFCIDPPDSPSCYPQTETVCKLQRVLPEGLSGPASLRYFSEDEAHNLEVVSEIPVVLDTQTPVITFFNSFDAEGRSLWISLSATEDVTCDGILTDVHQGIVRAGRGSTNSNAIDAERGRSFSRMYYSIDDGVYVYQNTCSDEAGNRAYGEHTLVIDTNRIHPQTPTGILTDTGDQVITVRTDADAECKYGPQRESYERMPYTFRTTGGTVHTTTVAGCTNCFKEWYVSCIFDGVEEGNDQDVVRYSVDLAPPRVLAFNTLDADVEFDASTVYGSTQNIFLKCVDDDIKVGFGVIGYDFGCDSVTAADERTGSTLSAAGESMAGPLLVRGQDNAVTIATVETTVGDRGENIGTSAIAVTIDRTQPPLDVTVRNALTDEAVVPGRDMLGPLEYTIDVHSRGFVHDVAADVFISHPVSGYTESMVLAMSSEEASSTGFALRLDHIPEEDVPYDVTVTVRGETEKAGAMCAPSIADTVRYPSSTVLTFQLDTHLPEFTLEPLLDWDERGLAITTETSDYVGYPVYYYADEFTYYTNQTSIFVTGYVNGMARTPEVLFWSGPRVEELGGTPDVRVVIARTASSTLYDGLQPIVEPATQGAESVSFGRTIDASRHYWFNNGDVEPGHSRTSYGRYMRMYSVDHMEGTTAFLDTPLEADVLPSTTGFTYQYGDKRWPPDWFGEWVPLQEGENWVSIAAKSDTGITSVPEYRQIIVDTNAPEVIESLPGPSDTSQAVDTISIVVQESKQGAPLLPESLALDLNGTIIGFEDLVITSDDSDPEFAKFTISHTHDEPFNGTYHVRWIGHDKAANNLRSGAGLVEYDFMVGDGLALQPTWEIIGAAERDGIWYTADTRAPFVVDFSAETSTVDVVDVFFGISDAEGRFPTRESCTPVARNTFRCTYDPPLHPDEAYRIIVEARKRLAEGPGPIGRYASPPVVVDNEPPIITDVRYQDPIAEDVTLPVQIAVANERWALQGELHYAGDARNYLLDMASNDRTGRYVFAWDIPNYPSGLIPTLERANPITITLRDYAGNAGTPWTGTITLDMTPPSLLGFTFEPDVPFARADNYFTGSKIVRINGAFTDADIDAVVITPGNYDDVRSEFAPAVYASIRPDKTYEVILRLHGVENETTTTEYRYAVMDTAGNRVERPFQITVDMTPPEEPSITIS